MIFYYILHDFNTQQFFKGYQANIGLLISIDLMIGNYPYPNLMTHTPSMPAF